MFFDVENVNGDASILSVAVGFTGGPYALPCADVALHGSGPIYTVECTMPQGVGDGYVFVVRQVGNTSIERALIVNGWALADHSSLHADEVIARENLRGLWRGRFVHPDDWPAGVRLPGEPPPAPITGAQQAATLLAEYGHSRAALAALLPRIIHDVPDIRQLTLPGDPITDDHLTELKQLSSLEELNLDSIRVDPRSVPDAVETAAHAGPRQGEVQPCIRARLGLCQAELHGVLWQAPARRGGQLHRRLSRESGREREVQQQRVTPERKPQGAEGAPRGGVHSVNITRSRFATIGG